MATNSYSNLKNSSAAWNSALRNFGIVTVMNAKIYDVYDGMTMEELQDHTATKTFTNAQLEVLYNINTAFVTRSGTEGSYTYELNEDAKINFEELKANEIIALYLMTKEISYLKYLKTANATQEGPTKTITGGQNASPLVKYGKTARLEMQNALGNAEALEALTGLTVEYFRTTLATDATLNVGATDALHATTTFAGHKTVVGDTFLVDANTGKQVQAYIIFYDFLSDSLLSLTQDAEGDATVFDMNGDLNEVKILIGDDEAVGDEDGVITGTFYTILPRLDYATNAQIIEDNGLSD